MASHKNLAPVEFCLAKKSEFSSEPLRPPPLLRGSDLLELGYPRGPLYGEILHEAETRQLEGEITSRDEAIEWVRKAYPLPDPG